MFSHTSFKSFLKIQFTKLEIYDNTKNSPCILSGKNYALAVMRIFAILTHHYSLSSLYTH